MRKRKNRVYRATQMGIKKLSIKKLEVNELLLRMEDQPTPRI